MSTIATIGNLAVDRIAGAPPRAGGGVFHAARAAAHVGADAVAVTRCAPGDRATAFAPLESLGLPVTCADATETTAFSFHYEGDHRVMAVDAVGEPWTPEDVEGWASAALDGAGPWTRLWRITLPSLKRTLVLVVMTQIAAQLQLFGQAQLLTGGGPSGASRTVVLYIFEASFGRWELGYATAMAEMLFLLVLVVTAIQYRATLDKDAARP